MKPSILEKDYKVEFTPKLREALGMDAFESIIPRSISIQLVSDNTISFRKVLKFTTAKIISTKDAD